MTASGSTGATVSPSPIAAIGALPAPTIRGGAVVSPNVIAAIGLLPAPNIFGGGQGQAVQAPTMAIAVTDLNELLALTGANRGNGATSGNYIAVPVGMAYTSAVLSDAPAAYWRMEEASGNLIDAVAGYALTPFGNPVYQAAGIVGSAVTWAGDNDRFEAASAAHFAYSTGTIEAWIKTTTSTGGAGGYRGIVVKQFAFGMFAKNGVLVAFDWTGGEATSVSVADGLWHHAAFSFVPGTGLLYLDGVQVAVEGSFNVSNQNIPLVIGEGTNGISQMWDGQIDEVAVYPSVLSPARVAAHYIAGRDGTTMTMATIGANRASPNTTRDYAEVP